MSSATISFDPIVGYWKVTALFACDRDGWSEVYYFPQAPGTSAADLKDKFVANRLKVLGAGANLSVVRISDTGVPRSGYKFLVGFAGKARTSDDTDGQNALSDQCSAAIGIPFRAPNGQRRFAMTSGVPDDWIVRDNAADYAGLSVRGKVAFDAWKKWLLQAPWPLQIRERTPAPANPLINVTSLVAGMDGYWQATVDAVPTWKQGQQLACLGFKGVNVGTMKGIIKVRQVISASVFELSRGPAQYLGTPIYLGGGQLQANLYQMVAAGDTQETYLVTTRRRGRPFAARRGRSSVRR